MDFIRRARGSDALQPRWPDRLATAGRTRRRGGRRSRAIRRVLAAVLMIVAGVLALSGNAAHQTGITVLLVSRDLPVGAALVASDLSTALLPIVPHGALRTIDQAVGHQLSSPIRQGEVLTDVRLVTTGGPDPGPGRIAVPVRPADAGTVDLLTPGVHVAVLAVAPDGQANLLAPDAVVLAIPPAPTDRSGRLIVLAVPAAVADRITAAGVAGTVALRFANG